MRFDGTLARWNDDRGFGFITPTLGGQELFAHISAFPRGARPLIGEAVSFEVEVDGQGKKRAVNIRYPGRPSASLERRRPKASTVRQRPAFLGRIVALVIFALLGAWGYDEFSKHIEFQSFASKADDQTKAMTDTKPTAQPFSCDGRVHCAQMASCEEAKRFLRNCPGVKMDGDGDGVPCEDQWCASLFAK